MARHAAERAFRLLVFCLAFAIGGCSYVGSVTSLTPTETQTQTPTSVPSASAEPAQTTSPPFTEPPPTQAPDLLAEVGPDKVRKANEALAHWANVQTGLSSDAILIARELADGGGWHGPRADDQKVAFLNGAFEATAPLSTDVPAPGDVVWPDGSRQEVELISASEALQRMIDDFRGAGGRCGGCRPLLVTGAELVDGERVTSRGNATMPVWQFRLAPEDKPLDPITYVAVKDAAMTMALGNGGDGYTEIGSAYGHPADTEITVSYLGGACTDGYTAEAVESELAIVPIVREIGPGRNGPCIAIGIFYPLPVQLDAPLGDRVVLDLWSAYPVPIFAEDPPAPTRP